MKRFFRKKDNRGFSLVELIVVILIMAIIAVALAPQVMKWVGESRDSTDKTNIAALKTAASTACAEYLGEGNTIKAVTFRVGSPDRIYVYDNSTYTPSDEDPSNKPIADKISEVMGKEFPDAQKSDHVFEIKIEADAASITVTTVEASNFPTPAPTLTPTP